MANQRQSEGQDISGLRDSGYCESGESSGVHNSVAQSRLSSEI